MISRRKWWTFFILLAAFAGFYLLIGLANKTPGSGFVAAAATLLGPMTGAAMRNFQTCCLTLSLNLLPWFLPLPALALLTQIGATPNEQTTLRIFRWAAWVIGWLG